MRIRRIVSSSPGQPKKQDPRLRLSGKVGIAGVKHANGAKTLQTPSHIGPECLERDEGLHHSIEYEEGYLVRPSGPVGSDFECRPKSRIAAVEGSAPGVKGKNTLVAR
jgi:hypothetical protein